MEKKIKITMLDNKDISVSIDEVEKIRIAADQRKINANDIYEMLSYNKGDTYTVTTVNEKALDEKVLKFFAEMMSEIIKKLNKLSSND